MPAYVDLNPIRAGIGKWFDTEFGEDNIYAGAKEQAGEVSHEMFGEWMHRNNLSLTTAAEAPGISRRMVKYYRTAHNAQSHRAG